WRFGARNVLGRACDRKNRKSGASGMNQHRLLFELDRVATRFRLLRFCQLLAAAWIVAALLGLALWGAKVGLAVPLRPALPLMAVAALLLVGLAVWLAIASARDIRWVARHIEAAFPELR